MPTLNIFISHKHEDKIEARGIKKELTRFSGREIAVFLSSDIAFGDNWLTIIQKKLINCNLLLLLFTDKKASWDWCLYEAGMFTRLDEEAHKRVICLHSPDLEDPPGPLKHLQAIKADILNVENFLKNLYHTNIYFPDSQPIAPELQHDDIASSAKNIVSLMSKTPRESQQLLKQIYIHVPNSRQISPKQIPPDAEVIGDQASLALFNKRPGTWWWKDLQEEATKNKDQRWMRQLARAIHQASKRTATDPILSTYSARPFTGADGCKLYQPILNSVEWERDGSIKFQVLFNDEVTWRLPDIPENLAILHTAQSMALRFRYEVLRKYVDPLTRENGDSLRDILSELQEVIRSIEQEADSRGLLVQHKLVAIFKQNQKQIIKQMYADWYDIRAKLFEALEQGEIVKVKQCLLRLEELNRQFIPMAAHRYAELMSERLQDEGTLYTVEQFVGFSQKFPLQETSNDAFTVVKQEIGHEIPKSLASSNENVLE